HDAELMGMLESFRCLHTPLGYRAQDGSRIQQCWPESNRSGGPRDCGVNACSLGLERLGLAAGLLQLTNDFGEGSSFDELHGVEVHAALAADRVDRNDVRMMQLGRGLRLVLEALQMLGIHCRSERQDLEGNAAPQRKLFGFIDDSHASPAQFAQDAEIPK